MKRLIVLTVFIIASCASTNQLPRKGGICVTTDKTDSEPNIVISSGKCAKDE